MLRIILLSRLFARLNWTFPPMSWNGATKNVGWNVDCDVVPRMNCGSYGGGRCGGNSSTRMTTTATTTTIIIMPTMPAAGLSTIWIGKIFAMRIVQGLDEKNGNAFVVDSFSMYYMRVYSHSNLIFEMKYTGCIYRLSVRHINSTKAGFCYIIISIVVVIVIQSRRFPPELNHIELFLRSSCCYHHPFLVENRMHGNQFGSSSTFGE